MRKILFPALLILSLSACSDEGGGRGEAVPASPANDPAPANTPTSTPTTTTARPGTSANSEGVALNPPHGEPGHVCEIPVGQPLDGSGGDVTVDPGEMDVSTTIVPSPAEGAGAGTTPPGINPPHGEPGHVCEIPVGEPLPQ